MDNIKIINLYQVDDMSSMMEMPMQWLYSEQLCRSLSDYCIKVSRTYLLEKLNR